MDENVTEYNIDFSLPERDQSSNLWFSFCKFCIFLQIEAHIKTYYTITTSTTYTSFSFLFREFYNGWVLTIKCRERWMLDFPRRGEVVVSGERPCPECPEWNKWRKSDTCAPSSQPSQLFSRELKCHKSDCDVWQRVEWDSGEDQITMTDTAAEER